jgi:hypothetical protein
LWIYANYVASVLPFAFSNSVTATNFYGAFTGNGSGLTNVSSASISVATNSAPTNAVTPLFWIGITNGTSVYKVPLYR